MHRIFVVLTAVALVLGVQVAAGPQASAGCQGAQRMAFPCYPYVPCLDEDGDGHLECVSAADVLVDAVHP